MNGDRRFIYALISCLLLQQNIIVKAIGTNINRTTKYQSRTDFLASAGAAISVLLAPDEVVAKPPQASPQEDIEIIREALGTLSVLLDNWEKATVECIFADVPRELLESKNKEQLLEKASTFALFDKSTSVVSCKTSNKIVRDYLGVTGKGPLVNIDKKMLKRSVVDTLADIDDLETYYSEVEKFQQAISRASAASYTAGVSDFDSINNFEQGKQSSGDSNLEQAKRAIDDAKQSLSVIVSLLNKT